MPHKNEFSEIQRKNMEAAMRLAQLSLENSHRIMTLQSELARELLHESVEQAKAQTAASDPQELVAMRARYAQDTTQKMIGTAQKIAEVGNEARAEFSRLLTEQLAAGSHDLVDALQSFFQALPGQNSTVLESMQQAMANANNAFEQMAKASAAAFENLSETARKAASPKK